MSSYGMMSDTDIRDAIKNNEICITPFDVNDKLDKRLTPVGFNFSFSRFVVSVNQKIFFKIYEKNDERFFFLTPGDTAVALTKESIWVSKNIGGTFHSKVRYVALGLGHISTTLDPLWQGQLLISLNNPSKRKIKVIIAYYENGKWEESTFITLCMYRMGMAASKPSDNNTARLDTLYEIIKNTRLKTKNQQHVVGIVKKIMEFLASQKKNYLSDPDNMEKDDINTFINNHKALMGEWDKEYPKIQELNESIIFIHRLFKLLPKILIVLLIVILGVIAYCRLDVRDFISSVTVFASAILGAVIGILWGKKED